MSLCVTALNGCSVSPYTTSVTDPVTSVIYCRCDVSGALYTGKWFGFHCLNSDDKALPGRFKRVQIIDKEILWSDCRPLLFKEKYSQIDFVNCVLDYYPPLGHRLPIVQKQLNTLWWGRWGLWVVWICLILYCSSMLSQLYPATLACVLVFVSLCRGHTLGLVSRPSVRSAVHIPALSVQWQLCVSESADSRMSSSRNHFCGQSIP